METAEEWAESQGYERGYTDGEVSLHYVAAGSRERETVVLLHGFPEFWYAWRRQIDALAADYRVVVPDLRGYNKSDRPSGVREYALGRLRGDVFDLVQHVNAGTVHLVGHDWGGALALSFARHHPGHVRRLVVENTLDPERLGAQLRGRQLLRSWYTGLFQLPRVPERLLSARDYETLRAVFEDAGEAFTEEDLTRYERTWQQDGALTAALNYYRALGRSTLKGAVPLSRRNRVIVPALVVWGEEDSALRPEVADRVASGIDDPDVTRFPDAGHWPHAERPEEFNDVLRTFLSG